MKRALICCVLTMALVGAVTVSAASATGAAFDTTKGLDPYTEVTPSATTPGAELFRGGAGATERRGKKGGKQLLVGFGDPAFTYPGEADRRNSFDKAVDMNASAVRLYVTWRAVAPGALSPDFDPKDPGSPQYDWDAIDGAVVDAKSRGLRPILLIVGAPDWAEGPNRAGTAPPGTWKPRPSDLADFATAISRRYSGNYQSLPQVRDYMVWNEPNLPLFLTPQFKGRKLKSATQYRKMLNAVYDAVNRVSKHNNVITGGTAPYGGGPSFGDQTTRPLEFWRNVMCVKGFGKSVRGTKCPSKPKFDVLAHHPIDTSGGPTTSAVNRDDVSMPDVHNLVDVLRAAEKHHNIEPGGKHQIWATEFWWESNPPDTYKSNPSLATQARWYAQSLYLLWKQGVSLALLYQVQDEPHYGPPGRFPGSSYETGEYFADGKAKPSARAVGFPFVADRKSKKKVVLWSIAPKSGKLVVTQSGKGPKKVGRFRVRAGKVFTKTVKLKGRPVLTAKVGGEKSLKWKLK